MCVRMKIGMTEILLTVVPTATLLLLKVFGVIHWSWWLVFAPMWVPLCLLLVVAVISNTVFELLERMEDRRLGK